MPREYVEIPPEVHKLAFDWIEREYDKLKTLVRNYCQLHPELADEMFSEVVAVRVAEAMMTYKPWMPAALRTHIYGNLKWYLYKYITDYERDGQRFTNGVTQEQLTRKAARTVALSKNRVLEVSDEVQYILEKLPPYERALLTLKFMCGYSLHEMSGVLELSYGATRKRYNAALDAARRVANE